MTCEHFRGVYQQIGLMCSADETKKAHFKTKSQFSGTSARFRGSKPLFLGKFLRFKTFLDPKWLGHHLHDTNNNPDNLKHGGLLFKFMPNNSWDTNHTRSGVTLTEAHVELLLKYISYPSSLTCPLKNSDWFRWFISFLNCLSSGAMLVSGRVVG